MSLLLLLVNLSMNPNKFSSYFWQILARKKNHVNCANALIWGRKMQKWSYLEEKNPHVIYLETEFPLIARIKES
jgi:hypothetical protein